MLVIFYHGRIGGHVIVTNWELVLEFGLESMFAIQFFSKKVYHSF